MFKKITVLLIMTVFVLIFFVEAYGEDNINTYNEKALVLNVEEKEEELGEGFQRVQVVEIKIETGKYKNEIFTVDNVLSDNIVFDLPVKKGDKVVVYIEEHPDGQLEVNILDYVRDNYIYALIIIFTLTLLITGRYKGLKTIATLVITMFSIFKVLLPLMLKGYNPITVTILVSVAITIITITTISGFNVKGVSAIIGTVFGVVIAGLLVYFVGTKVKLTGLSSEEAVMLLYIPQGIQFNFRDLLFSGILLGALGAVMDVSMSIASSVEELNAVNNNLTKKELFLSGMNVGKDIMGTMSNTLILAYTGSAIPLILLFMAYEDSLIRIINLDVVATEIIRSLCGSIGLILTIPITAVVSSMLLKRS